MRRLRKGGPRNIWNAAARESVGRCSRVLSLKEPHSEAIGRLRREDDARAPGVQPARVAAGARDSPPQLEELPRRLVFAIIAQVRAEVLHVAGPRECLASPPHGVEGRRGIVALPHGVEVRPWALVAILLRSRRQGRRVVVASPPWRARSASFPFPLRGFLPSRPSPRLRLRRAPPPLWVYFFLKRFAAAPEIREDVSPTPDGVAPLPHAATKVHVEPVQAAVEGAKRCAPRAGVLRPGLDGGKHGLGRGGLRAERVVAADGGGRLESP